MRAGRRRRGEGQRVVPRVVRLGLEPALDLDVVEVGLDLGLRLSRSFGFLRFARGVVVLGLARVRSGVLDGPRDRLRAQPPNEDRQTVLVGGRPVLVDHRACRRDRAPSRAAPQMPLSLL